MIEQKLTEMFEYVKERNRWMDQRMSDMDRRAERMDRNVSLLVERPRPEPHDLLLELRRKGAGARAPRGARGGAAVGHLRYPCASAALAFELPPVVGALQGARLAIHPPL